jgi:dTDP-4-amino-4,6-dideoxygalactose transaminase
VPAITFAATANCVRYVGGEVIFADVDPDTGLMTPGTFAAALARAGEAKAVFPVHMNGPCADMEAIAAFARARGLAIVEDASHALGTTYALRDGGRAAVGECRHSDLCVFSFHPVKTVAMGEGGALTAREAALARRLALLRTHGIERDADRFVDRDAATAPDGSINPWYQEQQLLGLNYRATDLQCALGLSQLAKLDRFKARRAALVARYRERLASLAPLARPLPVAPGVDPAFHLMVVLIDFAAAGTSRAAVMRRLRDAGVGSQVHYLPVYRHPFHAAGYGGQRLPGAEAYYARCLSLPLWVGLADADVDRVVDALAAALGAGARRAAGSR